MREKINENLILPHSNQNNNYRNSRRNNNVKRHFIFEAIYKIFHSYEPFEGEEEYSLVLHLLHQLIFYGLLMTGILLFEVSSLNIVSLPTDQQRASFLYEIKYPELWQAQLFREYYHELIFQEPSTRNTSSFDDGIVHLKLQFETFFTHYSLILKSIQIFQHLKEESQFGILQNLHYDLSPTFVSVNQSIVDLLYHSDYDSMTNNEAYILGSSQFIREKIHDFNEYVNLANYLSLYEREEKKKDPYYSSDRNWHLLTKRGSLVPNNELLPLLYDIDLGLTSVESKLVGFLSSPRLHSISTEDYENHLKESAKMLSRIQKAKNLNYLCEKAIYRCTNDTLEAKTIFDTGKYFLFYLVENYPLLLWKFHHNAMFHFDHLIAVMLFLSVFWWYKSDLYNNIVNNNNNFLYSNDEKDKEKFQWSKKTFIPIFLIAINYFITFTFLRTLRVMTYWSTILPPENISCKQRKFADSLTWSAPLIERFFSVFSETNSLKGGCNDLIFSGHVSLYVMTCIVFHRYCPSVILTGIIYLMALEPSLDAIIKGQHYTVDVAVAVYLTIIIEQFVYRHITPKIIGAELMEYNLKYLSLYQKPFWQSLRDEILFVGSFLMWFISFPFRFFSKQSK